MDGGFESAESRDGKFLYYSKRRLEGIWRVPVEGGEGIRAMAAQKVYIGRVWPSWSTYVRVTVGSREDMARFKDAWLKVMSA